MGKNQEVRFSILLESYCNDHVCRRPGPSEAVSILFESYCNTRVLVEGTRYVILSILLESYCNEPPFKVTLPSWKAFNSLRVLLQRGPSLMCVSVRKNLSILFESYCNIFHHLTHPGRLLLSILFESYCNLDYVNEKIKKQIDLSILFESYCNQGHRRVNLLYLRLSILFESYCNRGHNVEATATALTFNSLRVLLQRVRSRSRFGDMLIFQFSSSLIATAGA
ncbi:protein of unknown function [Thermococcus nautili]|nr:protein of unknown function [Thermococcus nautili]